MPAHVTIVQKTNIIYTHCGKDSTLFNSVLCSRVKGDDFRALTEEVVKATGPYQSRWLIYPSNCNPEAEKSLDKVGYKAIHQHYAYTLNIADFEPRPQNDLKIVRVQTLQNLIDCLNVGHAAFGSQCNYSEDELRLLLNDCIGDRVDRFVAYNSRSDEPMASGGLTLHPKLGFAFMWGGGTHPEHRSQGAYSALVAARVAFVKQQQLANLGLFARLNTSAPIVEKQGFLRGGKMTAWERSGG